MARRKGPERDSRAALLAAAWDLFREKGVEAASVDAIATRAGLSKGTFFHFFPTKMAMLEALCERMAEEGWREVGPIFEARDRDPLDRLDSWLRMARARRLAQPRGDLSLLREVARDENALLLKKLRGLSATILAPALARLIAEGNERGQFHVADPEATTWIVIDLGMAAVTANVAEFTAGGGATASGGDALDGVIRRANATIEAIERILGAPPAALHRLQRQDFGDLADPVRS